MKVVIHDLSAVKHWQAIPPDQYSTFFQVKPQMHLFTLDLNPSFQACILDPHCSKKTIRLIKGFLRIKFDKVMDFRKTDILKYESENKTNRPEVLKTWLYKPFTQAAWV